MKNLNGFDCSGLAEMIVDVHDGGRPGQVDHVELPLYVLLLCLLRICLCCHLLNGKATDGRRCHASALAVREWRQRR